MNISLTSSSIAVGFIPIAIRTRQTISENRDQRNFEHKNAIDDIEKLKLLDTDNKHLFIRRTLETFYTVFGANKLCKSFIEFRSNDAFYNSLSDLIQSKGISVWGTLVNSIDQCIYFLPNDSQLRDPNLSSQQKLDLFLAMMVDEIDLIDVMCYRYLTMKIEEDLFLKFEKRPILIMYGYSFYFLVELRVNDRFTQIDAICSVIKDKKEGI